MKTAPTSFLSLKHVIPQTNLKKPRKLYLFSFNKMDRGCLVCNNLFFYRYLNTTAKCPFCYLLVSGQHVFNSLAQWFGAHATKIVVLGGSGPRTITVLEDRPDPYGSPVNQFGSATGENGRDVVVAAKPKVVRKSVSINHNVEYIEDYVSNKKRWKAMEQWPSMKIEGDQLKPLKSILKVGSKQNMKGYK